MQNVGTCPRLRGFASWYMLIFFNAEASGDTVKPRQNFFACS
jgi:hypothetical protein